MSGVNKVILVGRLGRDPEAKNTQSGAKIVNMTVATSDAWTDKSSGERKERTEWHRVVIFDERLADIAERYLTKGSQVYLEGELRTRKWTDQSGQEKYSTEVVLAQYRGSITMLGSKSDREPSSSQEKPKPNPSRAGSMSDRWSAPDDSDDIPF